MPDIAVPYTLVTPGGTINFNNTGTDRFNSPGTDEYYITEAPGLNGQPALRTPIDKAPQAHGGLVHNFWKDARHFTITGIFAIRSTRIPNNIMIVRNQMEETLMNALDSILQADGTLSWTPRGLSARSLTVRCEIPFEPDGIELGTFTFGLVAANPAFN